MNDDDKFTLTMCCIVAVAIGVSVFMCTYKAWQDDAVRSGHAEYYIDHTNFSRQWRWRTNCCPPLNHDP